jgi:nucleoside-diphosphate-sugar epimerase/3-hydroxymyristoyl/3-hydroxydecanoyl-(acyl carrier protein) dehydratase
MSYQVTAPAPALGEPSAQEIQVLDRTALTEYAQGAVSAVFGPRFQRLDDLPRRVRLPRGRMLMVDRVTAIEAQPGGRGHGVIRAETDVRPDSWFLDPGGRIPASLIAETAQIVLPLITYLGLDLDGQGDRTARALDLTVTFHGPRARAGETLRHELRIDSHVEHGGMMLVSGSGESRVDGKLRVEFDAIKAAVFGWTGTTAEGLAWDPATVRLDETLPFQLPDGVDDRQQCWPELVRSVLPDSQLRMVHEVTAFEPTGGPWRRGYLRAEYPIAPDDWYFTDHFPGDPCLPGSLMTECGLQAMALFLAALGYRGGEFDVVPGHTYRGKFRGEATPDTKLMTCELFVSSVTARPYPTLQADILISFDGVKAAHCPGAAVRLVPNERSKLTARTKASTEHHVLTGGTGFIGSSIALELLDRTDATVTCLARPRPGLSADDRVKAALRTTAELSGRADLAEEVDRRCRGMNGDISDPACGIDLTELGQADQLWHLAALLAFEDHRKDDLFRQNIDGTRNVLELARQASARCFNHVSTAYVAGKRSGSIAEEPAAQDTECSNWYEVSKIAAESAVQASGLPVIRIMRPSIVIGHSRTLATTSGSAYYSFARRIAEARQQLVDTIGDALATRVWRMDADPAAELNVIPVDRVVTAAVRLAMAEVPSGIYHLTNAYNTTISEFTKAVCEVIGIREPLFADDDSDFSMVDRLVNDHISVFRPYLRGAKTFATDRVRAHLDDPVLEFATSEHVLTDLLRWYFDHIK